MRTRSPRLLRSTVATVLAAGLVAATTTAAATAAPTAPALQATGLAPTEIRFDPTQGPGIAPGGPTGEASDGENITINATSTVNVTYSGFTPQAQAAFAYAADLVEGFITSTVPIEVRANWAALGSGVLGSAGPAAAFRDQPGLDLPFDGFLYPVALANAVKGQDLCPPGDPCILNGNPVTADINATFSSAFSNWYFGTDGNPPAGKIDFVSVVLHELVHGLGFIAFSTYSGGTGSFGVSPSIVPGLFARSLEDSIGINLVFGMSRPSTQLGTAFTSGNVFYNSTNAVAANGGVRPKVYAPNPWEAGSSISHLDETTYGPTNPNALMTPSIGSAQASHDPGPISRGILTDMGWTITPIPDPISPIVPADFDGNGATDRSVYRPANGSWFTSSATIQHGAGADIPVPGDYDGNGTTDKAVYRPSNGKWYVAGQPVVTFGASTDVPVPGDYDGDGTTDIAVFRPSNGKWYVNGGATTSFGAANDIPVPGDYDGNGTTDIAVYRPASGRWYVNAGATTQFGAASDVPVPGDYDGNGTTDIAVFRTSNGKWYVNGGATTAYGASGDIPVPGDYDGNGTTDIAVYRPGVTARWFIAGVPGSVAFGNATDIPLPLPYAIRRTIVPGGGA